MTFASPGAERRIPAGNGNGHDRLKTVAGLIKNLSYREITKLAELMDPEGGSGEHTDLINMLLGAADEIGKEKA